VEFLGDESHWERFIVKGFTINLFMGQFAIIVIVYTQTTKNNNT